MNRSTSSIQTRILWGYALIVVLVFGILLWMVWSIITLNQQIQQVQRDVTANVDVTVGLAQQVTHSQNMVDRYLHQPSAQNLLETQSLLRDLTGTIETARTNTATQADEIEQLVHFNTEYKASFEGMRRLLGEQAPIRDSLQVQLATVSGSIDDALLTAVQEGTLSLTMLQDATAVQHDLRVIVDLLARMTPENSTQLGTQAQEHLQQAGERLSSYAEHTSGETGDSFAIAQRALGLVEIGLEQTVGNAQRVSDLHTKLVHEQGNAMQQLVTHIERDALDELTIATQELEQQTQELWFVLLLGLIGIPVVAVVMGSRQARAISGPITALVGATKQIPQGNYDVLVDEQAGGESGQLARAFNQMTLTLKEQRADLLQQQCALQAEQAATAQRNAELEQALHEIQVATAARDALADTVRELSVPIIPILQHVIVVPLVGEIDEARAHLLMQQLLAGIGKQQARIAILDLTGVPNLDALTATRLIETTTAARLLGTRVVLVGIRPSLAKALLETGNKVSALITMADLRSAVEYALKEQRVRRSAERNRAAQARRVSWG
ncbi:MAG: HAMP domain-containing protein [Chloroflexaceae bacterium]|nr:HAMP domain-containing protein [Chloroflexaceae bacterium]